MVWHNIVFACGFLFLVLIMYWSLHFCQCWRSLGHWRRFVSRSM